MRDMRRPASFITFRGATESRGQESQRRRYRYIQPSTIPPLSPKTLLVAQKTSTMSHNPVCRSQNVHKK